MLHRYTVASVCGVHEGRFLAYLHGAGSEQLKKVGVCVRME